MGRASWADRRLFIETVVWLGVARFLVLTVPFRWLAARLGRVQHETPAEDDPRSAGIARRVGGAVAYASTRTPWRSNCLAQAVAAHAMLRRRRVASTLYLGVSVSEGRIEAHAWLRSGARVITGGRGHRRYTSIVSFG